MLEQLKNIKLVITDVDGVLTDGKLYYDANGEALKCFHVRDGLGIRMLIESGVQVAVLSGRDSAILRRRIADLDIEHALLGKLDKQTACIQLFKDCGVAAAETLFIGDDSVDLPAFALCGVAVAVNDAPHYIQAAADYTLESSGGNGAFRELADKILEAKGKAEIYSQADTFLATAKKMSQ